MIMTKKNNFIYDNLLNGLQKISLDELDKVKLLDRKDTKFVFNQIQLPSIIDKIGKFGSSFQNLTLDTVKKFLKDSRDSNFKI